MDKQHLIETETGRERLYSGKILNLDRLHVRLPGGKEAQREVVMHKGACAVLPVNGRGEAAMVWQYRAAIGALSLEIPAGKLDHEKEDPEQCARRELLEETGLAAGNLRHLASFYSAIGFTNEIIHLYLATDLSQHESSPDEDEYLDVEWIPLADLQDRAEKGQITDSKTLIALLMARSLG